VVGVRRGQDQHGVGRRLLERLEETVLCGFGHPLGICQQGDPQGCHEGLEAQELLKRLVVGLRPAFRMKPDFVDADRFRPVI